jgi:hypothetical protein
MTVLSANRLRDSREVNSITTGVKAAIHIFAGALVFNDAGVARGGVPTATTTVLGVAQGEADNTSGADGAIKVTADRNKAYPFANGASGDLLAPADIGNAVYAIDDNTVGKTSGSATRPIAGTLVSIDAQGQCWVKVG